MKYTNKLVQKIIILSLFNLIGLSAVAQFSNILNWDESSSLTPCALISDADNTEWEIWYISANQTELRNMWGNIDLQGNSFEREASNEGAIAKLTGNRKFGQAPHATYFKPGHLAVGVGHEDGRFVLAWRTDQNRWSWSIFDHDIRIASRPFLISHENDETITVLYRGTDRHMYHFQMNYAEVPGGGRSKTVSICGRFQSSYS